MDMFTIEITYAPDANPEHPYIAYAVELDLTGIGEDIPAAIRDLVESVPVTADDVRAARA